jgi:hypothetical protein
MPFIMRQQVQPAAIMAFMQSQQAWIILQHMGSPLVQVTTMPSEVMSVLQVPMVMLQQQAIMPFIMRQQESAPPAIDRHRPCIMAAAILSSQRQVIRMPPSQRSMVIVQRGTVIIPPDIMPGAPPAIGMEEPMGIPMPIPPIMGMDMGIPIPAPIPIGMPIPIMGMGIDMGMGMPIPIIGMPIPIMGMGIPIPIGIVMPPAGMDMPMPAEAIDGIPIPTPIMFRSMVIIVAISCPPCRTVRIPSRRHPASDPEAGRLRHTSVDIVGSDPIARRAGDLSGMLAKIRFL